MHFRTAVSRRQRRIYRVSTDRLSGSSVQNAPAMPAEMRRAVVKFEPATFVRVDPAPDGSTQDGHVGPPAPHDRQPRSRTDPSQRRSSRPARPSPGTDAARICPRCTKCRRTSIGKETACRRLLAQPTGSPHSPARMPSLFVDQLGRVEGVGGLLPDGTWSTEGGEVGHPRFQKVTARICIFAWGLSVCGAGVYEGWGMSVQLLGTGLGSQ